MVRGKALYDWTAQEPDEVTFRAGEMVEILDQTAENGWWLGRVANGSQGTFPSNYVEIINDPAPAPAAPAASPMGMGGMGGPPMGGMGGPPMGGMGGPPMGGMGGMGGPPMGGGAAMFGSPASRPATDQPSAMQNSPAFGSPAARPNTDPSNGVNYFGRGDLLSSPPPLPKSTAAGKEGYLTKQGHVVKNWKRRWVRVRGFRLWYYKQMGDGQPAGMIDLSKSTVMECPSQRNFTFSVDENSGKKVYLFQAEDSQDMKEWVKYLQDIVGQHNRARP